MDGGAVDVGLSSSAKCLCFCSSRSAHEGPCPLQSLFPVCVKSFEAISGESAGEFSTGTLWLCNSGCPRAEGNYGNRMVNHGCSRLFTVEKVYAVIEP